MSADARTLAFYETEAHEYAERSRVASQLGDFIAALPAGACVLDLGCGAGFDSAALRDAGMHVTSVDASPALGAEARRRHGLEVRRLAFEALDYERAFDGVWANASLHHAQRAHLPAIFEAIWRAMKPNGLLHASLKLGEVDRRDKFGRFYCAVDEQALAALSSRFSGARITRHSGAGYFNEPAEWLMLDARRPATEST